MMTKLIDDEDAGGLGLSLFRTDSLELEVQTEGLGLPTKKKFSPKSTSLNSVENGL